MRRRWKKHAGAWVCYVLLGAATNFIAPWFLARAGWGTTPTDSWGAIQADDMTLLVTGSEAPVWASFEAYRFYDLARATEVGLRMESIGKRGGEPVGTLTSVPGWVRSAVHEHGGALVPPNDELRGFVDVTAIGWPALSVKTVEVVTASLTIPIRRYGMLTIGKHALLPYLPIWPGLALNALVYSPVFFALHEAQRWWVRHLGRSNGLCPACDYDRKGLAAAAPCPECGAVPRGMPAPAV